jgi:3-oxo-5-alpha-steroid 4-dehydrogenase 1
MMSLAHTVRKTVAKLWLTPAQITSLQWLLDWYPMGKTSNNSRINVPGKWGWAITESTGFVTLLYIMYTLPAQQGIKTLPWGNWTMAGCFVCFQRLPTFLLVY